MDELIKIVLIAIGFEIAFTLFMDFYETLEDFIESIFSNNDEKIEYYSGRNEDE